MPNLKFQKFGKVLGGSLVDVENPVVEWRPGGCVVASYIISGACPHLATDGRAIGARALDGKVIGEGGKDGL